MASSRTRAMFIWAPIPARVKISSQLMAYGVPHCHCCPRDHKKRASGSAEAPQQTGEHG